MIANWTRCCGLHSTVAPESRSTTGCRRVGIIVASAGRSTPGRRPNALIAAITDAGVTGAEDGGRGALSNRISGKPDRRTRLAPERDRCRLTHGNGLRRIQDFQIERAAARMPRELALDRRAIAD